MQALKPSPGLFRLQMCAGCGHKHTCFSAILHWHQLVISNLTPQALLRWAREAGIPTAGLFITMLIRHMFLDHTSCKEIMQTVLLTKAGVSGLLLTVSSGSRGHETPLKSEHPWKHSPIPAWKPVRPLRITSWWLLPKVGEPPLSP